MQPIIDNSLSGNQSRANSYYSTGYKDFKQFWNSQNWQTVETFELYADEAFDETNYRLKLTDNSKKDLITAKHKLLNFYLNLIGDKPLNYLEFGVRAGVSMNLITKENRNERSLFYGFDTFEGLPEDWVPQWGNKKCSTRKKGAMAVSKMPVFEDKRVKLFKGLFQDKLPDALTKINNDSVNLINIDCDIYTGALYALTMMHPYLKNGDFLYFDELFDTINEFAAFNDYIRSYYLRDKFILLGRAYDAFIFRYDA